VYNLPGFKREKTIPVLYHNLKAIIGDMPANAYGFTCIKMYKIMDSNLCDKCPVEEVITYFVDSRIMTLDEVKRCYSGRKGLIANMEYNHWDKVIETKSGWCVPYSPTFVLLKRKDYE